MAINNAEYATTLADIIQRLKDNIITEAAAATELLALTDSWTNGATSETLLGTQLSAVLGNWNHFTAGQLDWLTVSASGGPHADGTVDLIDYLGNTTTVPGLAKLTQGVAKGDPAGLGWNFSTTTTDSDPGAGAARANHATLASVTAFYLDNLEAGGASATAWLDTWDDASTTVKGVLKVTQADDPTKWALFNVTGSVVDGTGYRKVTVAYLTGTSLPANTKRAVFSFQAAGSTGAGDVVGPASAVADHLAVFNGTTGKIIKDGGAISANALTFVAAANFSAMRTALGVAIGTDVLGIGGGTLTGPLVLAADPSSALHPATKQYVDNLAAGLDVKASVKCASTANLTLSGEQTIDGVLTSASRVLVKDQSTGSQNGIYVTAAGAWARASDMDAWAEFPGANVWVEEGTANGDRAFVCTNNAGGTLGTTAATWVQFGGTGAYQAASPLLAALAGMSPAADKLAYWTGGSSVALTDLTAYARSLLAAANAGAALTLLGAVPASRLLTAAGLATGGGDHSADRTITVPAATNTEAKLGLSTTTAMTPAANAAALDNVFEILEHIMLNDSVATLGQASAQARRGVEIEAARSNGERRFRVGLVSSSALTDVATVTRATTAWGVDQAGMLSAFTAGQPVVTTAGLAVYEARTNSIRNPVMTGAAAGSPGTLPTNWVAGGSTPASVGLTQTLATGTEDGRPYLEVTLAGTPSATGSTSLNWESASQIAASVDDVWTATCNLKQIGAATGVASFVISVIGRDSGGAGTGTISSSVALSTTRTKFSNQATLVGATTAFVHAGVGIGFTSGVPLSLTYRIYAPNQKKGVDINDPSILQATNAAATRNADVITEAVNIPVGQAFTVLWQGVVPTVTTTFPRAVHITDPTFTTNSLFVFFSGSQVFISTISAGISAAALVFSVTPGAVASMAVSMIGDRVSASVNGSAVSSGTMAGGPLTTPLSVMGIGCDPSAGNRQLNGTIRDLNVVMRAYSSAELQAASDVSLTHDIDFTTQSYRYVGDSYAAVTDLPMVVLTQTSEILAQDQAGQWRSYAAGVVPANTAGLNILEGAQNKCTAYNAAPNGSLTNITKGGDAAATLTEVDDTAQLRAAGFGPLIDSGKMNGKVFKLDNTAGVGTATIRFGGVSGNTNPHTASVFWRGTVNFIGCVNFSGATTFGAASGTSAGYVRGGAKNGTPTSGGATTSVYCDVAAGQVAYFIFCQLEERPYATNPVITGGAQATRSQNALSWADSLASGSTIFAEFTMPTLNTGAGQVVFRYDDGTDSNKVLIRLGGNLDQFLLEVVTGGVSQGTLGVTTTGVSAGAVVRVAARIATNDLAMSVLGGTVQTDTSATLPAVTTARVGSDVNGGQETLTVPIRKIRRYSTPKTNSELQALAA